VLPLLIFSRIRRTSGAPMLVLQAFVLFACMGGFEPADPSAAVPAWARTAIPAFLALSGLVLRDAYRETEQWSLRRTALDIATVVLCVAAAEAVLAGLASLSALSPAWQLPTLLTVGGTILALPMLVILRVQRGLDAESGLPEATDPSFAELAHEYGAFESHARFGRRIEAIAVLAICAVAAPFDWIAPPIVAAIGWSWIGLSVILVWYLVARGSVRRLPAGIALTPLLALYRAELDRQRSLSHSLWWWYFVPLFAGLAINLIVPGIATRQPLPTLAGSSAVLLLFFFIAKLNHDRNRRLGERIAFLDRLSRHRPA
jgi:hypothetical protein